MIPVSRPELIVALDVPTTREALALVDRLEDRVSFYKVGLELFCAKGPDTLRELRERGKKIFLDLKLHDIPNTVERAVRAAATHEVSLITIHALGGKAMLEAATTALRECGPGAPRLIAVTTLTSLRAEDFADLGIQRSLEEQALALGRLALDAGLDGLVTSVLEAPALRTAFGPKPLLITPGIRMPADEKRDQHRVATPRAAVRAGASFLVVGRPIVQAVDPAGAAEQILASMWNTA